MGKSSKKIATPQISLKFRQKVEYRTTHYCAKHFDWALSGLTSRGQIDIQITWDLWAIIREYYNPSNFAQILGQETIWPYHS